MGSAAHRASAITTPVQHAEHTYQVAQGDTPAMGIEEVATSWQRCANEYGVNPLQNDAPRILTSQELQDLREPLEILQGLESFSLADKQVP